MSRAEAFEQYITALKMGKRYYNACMAKGVSPYPAVLEEMLEKDPAVGTEKIGLVDIPMDRIVGTWTAGRKAAFAGNFMPLLEQSTEFGGKWIALCEAHLGDEGITDPITCIEYMGLFYVQEGNKRVSVLKSYDSPSIPGIVTRMIPALTDDKDVRLYYEFMKFYKLSKSYVPEFTQLGSFQRLQAELGLQPDQEWTEDIRHDFDNEYRRFARIFDQLNTEKLPLKAGDCLLSFLEIYTYSDMTAMPDDKLRSALSGMWADIRNLSKGQPISVSAQPEKKEMGLLNRILGAPRVQAAFIYSHDPDSYAWASAHARGQKWMQEQLGDSVKTTAHVCGDDPDAAIDEAVAGGANVIFATSPTLNDACRRAASRYKNVLIYNCSLSMPYAGVRSYYCRIYEGKFIAGAIAGAMQADGRIGYVANYPIMGVTAAINAFALGARLTNPRSVIDLRWSCLPGDPAEDLIRGGCRMISGRDEDGATTSLAGDMGICQVGPEGQLTSLAAPRWKWGHYYTQTVRSILAAGIDGMRDGKNAINDWWGMSTDMVDVDLSDDLPDGVRRLANILRDGIIKGDLDPFRCVIRDRAGSVVNDGTKTFKPEELMRLDWLCDNVDGVIPAYDDLLDRSKELVRLLGIYRESILPLPEDVVK